MGRRGGDRRYDYLLDAVRYDGELTPAENRRRINELRAGFIQRDGASASLPGEARNAGASNRALKERLGMHPMVNGRRTS